MTFKSHANFLIALVFGHLNISYLEDAINRKRPLLTPFVEGSRPCPIDVVVTPHHKFVNATLRLGQDILSFRGSKYESVLSSSVCSNCELQNKKARFNTENYILDN